MNNYPIFWLKGKIYMTGNEFIEDLFFLFGIKQSEDTLKYIGTHQE